MRCEKLITARMMCSIMMMVMPCAVEAQQQGDDVLDLGMRQPGHGLVGDQQLGLGGHGAGQLELAHLDLREVARQRRALASSPTSAQQLEAALVELAGELISQRPAARTV